MIRNAVCVQICSSLEWQSILDLCCPSRDVVQSYPLGSYFLQERNDIPIIFFHSGIGKTRAGAACQYAIDHWRPDIVVVLGTCGGVAPKLAPLDIVIANRTVQYDCIVRMGEAQSLFYEPFTTEIDNAWLGLEGITGVRQGLIATADQDLNQEMLDVLRAAQVLCADWESGAIAYISKLNQVSCCVVRGVSDIPGRDGEAEKRQGEDYRRNTPLIMNKLLAEVLPAIVKSYVARTGIDKK